MSAIHLLFLLGTFGLGLLLALLAELIDLLLKPAGTKKEPKR